MSGRKRDKSTIIVRRTEEAAGSHHGGAWKVAYADFVTAMMAFFLLMWLLNSTTLEQRRGLADYFSPTSHLATITSGSGEPFAGHTPNVDGLERSDQGQVQVARTQPYPVPDDDDTGDQPTQADPSKIPGKTPTPHASEGGASAGTKPAQAFDRQLAQGSAGALDGRTEADAARAAEAERRARREERHRFEHAAMELKQAVANDPALADVAKQLMVEVTPEGLRVQLLDSERQAMFTSGSSALSDKARALIAKVAPILIRLPERIAISGHTDAAPYHSDNKTNWDLSTERANAARRLLVDAGLPEMRLRSVTGNADQDPLIKENPLDPANRRVSILLLPNHPEDKR